MEHPLYGEWRGLLMLNSRRQEKQFAGIINEAGVEPLSSLSNGVQLHNIEVSDEETKQLIIRELARAHILLRKQAGPTPYSPFPTPKSHASGFLYSRVRFTHLPVWQPCGVVHKMHPTI